MSDVDKREAAKRDAGREQGPLQEGLYYAAALPFHRSLRKAALASLFLGTRARGRKRLQGRGSNQGHEPENR